MTDIILQQDERKKNIYETVECVSLEKEAACARETEENVLLRDEGDE